jgi:hypothetical protein
VDEHARLSEELGAYLIGGFDPDETRRVRRHLEQCAECRDALAEPDGLNELLEGASLAEAPPPELEDRLMAAIEQASRAEPIRSPAPRPQGIPRSSTRAALGMLTAAAVFIMVLALGISVVTNTAPRRPSTPASPTAPGVTRTGDQSMALKPLQLLASEGSAASTSPGSSPDSSPGQQGVPATGAGGGAGGEPPATGPGNPSHPTTSASAEAPGQFPPRTPGGQISPRLVGDTWECEVTVWGLRRGQLYEVWFRGPKGWTSAGTFKVTSPEPRTFRMTTGAKIVDFSEVAITAEEDDGNPLPGNEVVLRGTVIPR